MRKIRNKKKVILIIIVCTIGFLSCSRDREETLVMETSDLFGIDVSHYNGDNGHIYWDSVVSQTKHKRIAFVIVRSTMGTRQDQNFTSNFNEAKERGFVVGAYHYYDPNQNSSLQAQNYINSVKLEKGDIIPILDIEKVSRIQSKDRLRDGLKNWISIIEAHYGVKPMIYSGLDFYVNNLKDHGFDTYPLWVAAYSPNKREDSIVKKAAIHQFSEDVQIPGIKGWTDGNDCKDIDPLLIK